MPPPKEDDGYKTYWVVDPRHWHGVSVLSFQDLKGAADARFHGAAEASVDALKLLNFLIGMNCPHPYDGIVAGTIAWDWRLCNSNGTFWRWNVHQSLHLCKYIQMKIL
jgi:hypothetical protein